jgi:hypothetical protein
MTANKRETDHEKRLLSSVETARKRWDKLKSQAAQPVDIRLAHKRLKRAQRALQHWRTEAARKARKKDTKE